MREEIIKDLDKRVTKIEGQMESCELMHKDMQERASRSDTALDQNTKASIDQTKAITDLTAAVCALAEKVEKDHDPIVKRSKTFQTWWDRAVDWWEITGTMWKIVVVSILSLAGLVTALKTLGVW